MSDTDTTTSPAPASTQAAPAPAAPATPVAASTTPSPTAAPASGDAAYVTALERLRAGEAPDVINGRRPAPDAPVTAPDQQQQAAPQTPGDQGQVADPWKGLSQDQVQWLKRDGFTEEDVKYIPASNLKSLASKARDRVTNRDRAYQQARQQQPGQQPGQQQQAAKPGDVPPASDPQSPTQPESADPAKPTQQQPPAQQQQGQPVLRLMPDWTPPTVSDADYTTLVEYAGQENADKIRSLFDSHSKALVGPMQQMETTIVNLMAYIDRNEFNSAMKELTTRPEYAKLTDDDKGKLRDKAEHLMRAHADPLSYRYADALPEAARALFNLDPVKVAQASLLDRRTTSLRNTGDPARQQQPVRPGPMTEEQRSAAILKYKRDNPNASWDDARNAVDAGAA